MPGAVSLFDRIDFNEDWFIIKYGVVGIVEGSTRGFKKEVERAKDSTTTPGSPATSTIETIITLEDGRSWFSDEFHNTARSMHYRARQIRSGYANGPFTTFFEVLPESLNDHDRFDRPDEEDHVETKRRENTLSNKDKQIFDQVTIQSTTGTSTVMRHGEQGVGRDGDAVSFSQDYNTVPKVVFVPQQAQITSGSTIATWIDMRAENITTTGFDLRAKIITAAGAGTTFNDGFSTALNASSEVTDKVLTTQGAEAFSNVEDATSGQTLNYDTFFDISNTTLMGDMTFALVDLYYNVGAASTAWVHADGLSFSNDEDSTDIKLTAIVALTSGFDLRMELTYDGVAPSATELATITVHGSGNTTPGVQFTIPGSGTTITMTPDVGDRVAWFAAEIASPPTT